MSVEGPPRVRRFDAGFPGRTRIRARSVVEPDGGPRFLALLLCYNDADMLAPVLRHLIANRHDVVVFDHGSEDETGEVARGFVGSGVIDYQRLDREEVPFRDLYGVAASYLVQTYGGRYDWLSWPDQDELLHGPDVARPYHEQVAELLAAGFDSVEFDNYVFWFTDADDDGTADPVERIRHYCLSNPASPRIRAWRFDRTNERRLGNSNPVPGRKAPVHWPLRHYPMRSLAQAERRVTHDRNQPGFQFKDKNWHYQRFREDLERLRVPAAKLHRFDGVQLDPEITWTFYERPDPTATDSA